MGVGADCDLRTGDKANEGESERIAHGICRGGLVLGAFEQGYTKLTNEQITP